MKNIVIFGASRGVGRCLTEQALTQGHRVTAAVRNPATVTIAHERLRVMPCDVLNPDAVDRAIAGQDVVFCTLGANAKGPISLYSAGAHNIVRGMQAHQVRRLIFLQIEFPSGNLLSSIPPISIDFKKMKFEFDHLFICTDLGALEADRLVSLGLVEGTSNSHPGQGTTNRRFFFHNAMLEFLWVCDPEEARSELIRPTYLWERWANRQDGACPFGVCLRPTTTDRDSIAFPSWAYRPPYLPEPLSIAVGTNSDVLTEPMLFQTPFGKRPDRYSPEKAQPLEHPIGWREITRVELVTPTADRPSPALQAAIRQSRRYANDTDRFGLRVGGEYCVELGFDGEVQGNRVDFRPGLPMVVSW